MSAASASLEPEPAAELQLQVSCLMIAAGGLLLGIQFDATGTPVGTGFTALGVGAIVALVATVTQFREGGGVPRDPVSVLSALCGFCGIAFVVSGVLAPGGTWMFAEVLLLLWLATRGRSGSRAPGPGLSGGSLLTLAFMLLFRLWVTYQGSENRWELMSIEIPLISAIPIAFLEPIQSVQLGSFRPEELGFPPTGLNFALSTTLWAIGFALCAAGMWWRVQAAHEHECDRIHATIQTLPPPLALLVDRILPEDDWEKLELFGLSERRRCKRVEALVRERLTARADFNEALLSISSRPLPTPARPEVAGFADEIAGAFSKYGLPPGGTLRIPPGVAEPTDPDPERLVE